MHIVVLFARSVLLSRLLPIDVFGIYGLASSVVSLSLPLTDFGMFGAFLHRAPETEDEEQAASNYFTLKLCFTLVWSIVLVAGAFIFTIGSTRMALVLLTITTGALHLAQVPKTILTRRVVHRRLALIQVLNALVTTSVAVGLAWQGVTLWALLATDVVTLILVIVILHLWRPVWRPRLRWSFPVVRYFLRFGSRNFLASILAGLKSPRRFVDWSLFGQNASGFLFASL